MASGSASPPATAPARSPARRALTFVVLIGIVSLLADRTHRYWAITITGYAINLLAVPALALAGNWPAAAALIILERCGKALRTPARDAMLAHAAKDMGGAGWA